MDYRYIVVEGSIGSGKSALSRRLAQHFDALLLSEIPESNPVLERFYLNEMLDRRLRQRNEGSLNLFPDGYLQQIHNEYRHFFHLYQHAPLLIANTNELDFMGNDDHFALLLKTIANMQGSRIYLNLSE